MKLKCYHGFFIFEETRVGQISDFIRFTGLKISPREDYFTFDKLLSVQCYSIKGQTVSGSPPALKTFSGNPWEVFEANQLVYNFNTDQIVSKSSIVQKTRINASGNKYVSPGLILPGSTDQNGKKILGYSAFYSRDRQSWYYSEVSFE